MGYIRHRAVLAITSSYFAKSKEKEINAFISDLNKEIEQIERPFEPYLELILISKEVINKCRTYIFLPDGSKIGWELSDALEKLRRKFMQKMKEFDADVIYINFGGDDSEEAIILRLNAQVYKNASS